MDRFYDSRVVTLYDFAVVEGVNDILASKPAMKLVQGDATSDETRRLVGPVVVSFLNLGNWPAAEQHSRKNANPDLLSHAASAT